MNGKLLNEILNIQAKHSLYREDGAWYHHLANFPGVLFDRNGYLIFNSLSEYISHPNLQHAKDLHIANGISSINGYVAFSNEDRRKIILSIKKNADEESIRIIRQVGVIIRDFSLARSLKRLYENTCQLCGIKLQIGSSLYYSEIHHIKPLGTPHNGLDKLGNMICVCPNCHVQLDLGGIELSIETITSLKHEIDLAFIAYHNEKIFQI
jgi:5-methylcytosine-specific restriction enzyme A